MLHLIWLIYSLETRGLYNKHFIAFFTITKKHIFCGLITIYLELETEDKKCKWR